MFSACAARLLSLLAGTRLQMLLGSEFAEADCTKWGKNIRTASAGHNIAADLAPILDRLEKEPEFAVQDLRWNLVTHGVIAFTSSVEYFLQDLVVLCLVRNSGLRKKAFSQHKIPALELEELASIDKIRLLHINIIANENTSGSLFSQRLKKAKRFLGVPDLEIDKHLLDSLDSIWKTRNCLAHENHARITKLHIARSNGDIELTRTDSQTDCLHFTMDLCQLFGDAAAYLVSFDEQSLNVWPADAFIEDG